MGSVASRSACALPLLLLLLLLQAERPRGAELTFELPDNAKQCFHEDVEQGVKFSLDYQVRPWRPAAPPLPLSGLHWSLVRPRLEWLELAKEAEWGGNDQRPADFPARKSEPTRDRPDYPGREVAPKVRYLDADARGRVLHPGELSSMTCRPLDSKECHV